ncbi:methyltransferase [Streptomyces alkaliphilus]|uniref:Methyltransferase n=1 Tax=Streptomyces alkaliphilus TaxID=1472722 RepID=A0A646III0_9ACTN|nr:methyltransferase [Streptomyces alkaliphilus]MQS10276.1 methyltransferase [Streptomyces alkaliphilus]
MPFLRAPGVYAPQQDTWLLREALADSGLAAGARVVDLCTGTGVLAMEALRLGAREARAFDASGRAVLTARCNAWLSGLPVRVRRGEMALAGRDGRRFDVVLANPPYVPGPDVVLPRRGARKAWEGGPDGRALVDRVCTLAPSLLRRSGSLLMVHSKVCGPARTVRLLRRQGMRAEVVAGMVLPFGPVMRRRAAWLEGAGLIRPGQRTEELVVVRADLA